MKKKHLYNGQLSDTYQIEAIENGILNTIGVSLPTEALLEAGEKLYLQLKDGDSELETILTENGTDASAARKAVCELSGIFSKSYLEDKLEHELGRIDPFVFRRFNMEENILEAYKPLGVLCHVAAGNAPGLGALSVLEGLMTGNINIVKLSSKENGFSAVLLHKLIAGDTTGLLAKYVYALDISSAEKDTLKRLFDFSSAIVAWGGVESIDHIKAVTQTPVIAWGHHISFGYLTKKGTTEKNLLGIARDICENNQQSCSSPQCLYYEGAYEELPAIAARLKKALETVSPQIPPAPMNIHEEAQITSSNIMVELGSCLNEGELIEAADRSFRIYLDASPALTPSPLYRTIWLKPMNRKEIVKYLQPMSRYLQTVSLGCALDEIYELSELFTVCGASRIAECGNVFFSYPGEPHDGVFALTKYCKRVSLVSSIADKIASFSQLQHYSPVKMHKPIQDKDAFMNLPIQEEKSKLYVKSGGSSGKTILSPYSYRDYHFEMQAVAETFIGIGLEPKTDRVMNLLNAGHLYGGFLSFSSILEHANAKHFPMSYVSDTSEAVSCIIEQRIDVLMGMPSYLLKLFRENEEALKAYRGIRKVYYGGEFMTLENKQMLKDTFGVELVASYAYGSNDVGPIGYACEHSEGGVHHLLTGIMDMEILKLDKDEPVESGETGRIILSPKFRQGSPVARYEIGDLGRWIEGDCPCGRKNPRFELTGRFGDIFRAGGFYFNYVNLLRIIREHLTPTQLQIVLEDSGTMDKLTFRTIKADFTREDLVRTLAEHNPSMAEALQYHFLEIALEQMNESDMEYTAQSRKLRHIIDLRTR